MPPAQQRLSILTVAEANGPRETVGACLKVVFAKSEVSALVEETFSVHWKMLTRNLVC